MLFTKNNHMIHIDNHMNNKKSNKVDSLIPLLKHIDMELSNNHTSCYHQITANPPFIRVPGINHNISHSNSNSNTKNDENERKK